MLPIQLKNYSSINNAGNTVIYYGFIFTGGFLFLNEKLTVSRMNHIISREKVLLVNKLPDSQMWYIYARK